MKLSLYLRMNKIIFHWYRFIELKSLTRKIGTDHLFISRVESAMIAVALAKNMQEEGTFYDKNHPIVKSLDFPDTVKENLRYNLKTYLQAITLSGIEKTTIRKMMIVGNTGMSFYYRSKWHISY